MSEANKDCKKILFSLCGDVNKASSRVRGFWIAEQLELLGLQCTLRWKHTKQDLLSFALEIPRNDVIIFQKTYSRYHRWLMALAKLLGKLTYLDLDDAPSRIQSNRTLQNAESMMRIANGVFAGSQNICDYAKQQQPKTYVLPSGINLKHYQPCKKDSDNQPLCLGWIGNGAHYRRDLVQILEGPFRILAAKQPFRFKLVGACGVNDLYTTFGAIPGLELDFIDGIDWSKPSAVSSAISDFDVGLYPLLPNDFNVYKCGFKALEYMATGIPVVSSPVAVNQTIISNGMDGLLAGSEAEWVEALSRLIESKELREAMGRAGRRKVEESFDVANFAARIRVILDKDLHPHIHGASV